MRVTELMQSKGEGLLSAVLELSWNSLSLGGEGGSQGQFGLLLGVEAW